MAKQKSTQPSLSETETEIKSKNIFDILGDLSFNKVAWEAQSESDQKKVQPYMLTRWLSMHQDYLDIVAEVQPMTDMLATRDYYRFWSDLLPKRRFFTKYVSGKKDKETDRFSKVVDFLSSKLNYSKQEMLEFVELQYKTPDGIIELRNYLKRFGYDDKSLKKDLGI